MAGGNLSTRDGGLPVLPSVAGLLRTTRSGRIERYMPFGARIREAFLAVWKKQQLALANLTGNAFLLVVVFMVRAPVPMVVGCLFGLWLMSATLAAFQIEKTETLPDIVERVVPAVVYIQSKAIIKQERINSPMMDDSLCFSHQSTSSK